jgi:spore germination cell wall hydrolase CwlJ-like protein
MYSNNTKHIYIILFSILLIIFNFINPIPKDVVEKAVVQQVSSTFNKEFKCLAENIYYEAASEPYEGKLAVAQVTINRTNSKKFPASVCEVVEQKTESTCQFTWFCEPKYPIRNKYQWEESLLVARKALTEPFVHDKIYEQNALYYHADYVNPGWHKDKITQIGRHIFYK